MSNKQSNFIVLLFSFLVIGGFVFSAPLPINTIPTMADLNARVKASAIYSDGLSVGIGTTSPLTGFQLGSGGQSLNANLSSSDSALIKGNLEVDGKIYGDGSELTGIAGGLSSVSVNYGLTGNGTPGNPLEVDDTVYATQDDISGFLLSESDPVFSLVDNHLNWNTAYSWGNHASAGYLTAEADTLNTVTGRGATTSNNIGLGTANPRTTLEIGTGATIITGSAPKVLVKGNLEVDGKIYGDGQFIVGIDTGGGDISGTLTANKIVKGTGTSTISTDSNIWSIGTNGNLGIGDSTPDGVLEIVKSGSLKSLLVSSAASGDGDYLTVNSAGNIGIGTITPTWKLAIGSGTSSKSSYAANSVLIKGKLLVDGGLYGELYGNSTGTSGYWTGSGSPVNIWNNNTGNVGIGVNPLNEKLGVEGKIFLRDTVNNSALGVNLGTHGASASYNASFQSNWTIPTSMTTASYILRIGSNAGASVTSGSYANFIGWNAGYYASEVVDSNYMGSFSGTNSTYGTREYFLGHYVAQYLNDGSTACTGTSGNSNADNFYIGNYGKCFDNDTQNSFNIGNKFKSAGDNKITIGGESHTAVVFHGNTGGLGSGAMNVGINSRSPLAMLDVEGTVYIGVGNLGIGTTAPRQKMEINGTIRASGYQSSDGTAGATVTTCTSFKNGLCVGGT